MKVSFNIQEGNAVIELKSLFSKIEIAMSKHYSLLKIEDFSLTVSRSAEDNRYCWGLKYFSKAFNLENPKQRRGI